MRSIRSSLRKTFPLLIVLGSSYLCLTHQCYAQIEEVLKTSTETQDLPTWLKASFFFKSNKQLLDETAAKKEKELKTDSSSLKTLSDYQNKISALEKIEVPFRLFLFSKKGTSGKLDGLIRRQYFKNNSRTSIKIFIWGYYKNIAR